MKINNVNSAINFKRVMKIEEEGNVNKKDNLTDIHEDNLLKALNEERNGYRSPQKKKIASFFSKYRDKKNKKAIIAEYNDKRYLILDKEAEDISALREYAKNVNNFPVLKIKTFYADDSKYRCFLQPFQETTKDFVETRVEKIIEESIRKNPITTISFDDKRDKKVQKITINEEIQGSIISKTLDLNA